MTLFLALLFPGLAFWTGTKSDSLAPRQFGSGTGQVHRIKCAEKTLVPDPVINARALLAVLQQPRPSQKHQLLRYVGLSHVEERRQVADTLFASAERVEQAQPRRVCQYFEKLRLGLETVHAIHEKIFRFLNMFYHPQVKIESRTGQILYAIAHLGFPM